MLTLSGMSCGVVEEYSVITDDYEVLTCCNVSHCFSVCYRPPQGKLDSFFLFIEFLLSFVSVNKYSYVLGGDLNINMLEPSKNESSLLLLLESYGCNNHVQKATRVTYLTESMLDLMITNYDRSQVSCSVIETDISDHFPVCITVDTTMLKKLRETLLFMPHVTLKKT